MIENCFYNLLSASYPQKVVYLLKETLNPYIMPKRFISIHEILIFSLYFIFVEFACESRISSTFIYG